MHNERVYLDDCLLKPQNLYKFKYLKPHLFPKRLSFSQDHWGYYNGLQRGRPLEFWKSSKIPLFMACPDRTKTSVLIKELIDSDFESTRYGILSEITYPTGGKSILQGC